MLFEVWTLTVPAGAVAAVELIPVFDGVLVIFDENGVLLSSSDNGFTGEAEYAAIDGPGNYLVVAAAYDPGAGGPYSIMAGLSPLLDDPRTASCQRGSLIDDQVRTSSLAPGDCRSVNSSALAEVWTLTVPPGMVATVQLTPAFDGVLMIYDENAVLLSSTNAGLGGDPEVAGIDSPGNYLVVAAAYDAAGSGAYSVVATITAPGLNGVYTGSAEGTYAGFPFNTNITFSLSTTGAALNGTWTTAAGTSGTLAGTIGGPSFTFTLTENVPCSGTYSGSGAIENAGLRLTGSFSGTDCGGLASLTFAAERTAGRLVGRSDGQTVAPAPRTTRW